MTEIIMGDRRSGRTTELIKRSAETGAIIVVRDNLRGRHVQDLANDLGYDIPKVLTVSDLKFPLPIYRKGLLVDDIDAIIAQLFHYYPIEAVTMRETSWDITKLGGILNE